MSRKLNNDKTELIIDYTLEGEEWAKAIAKAKQKMVQEITVPGFRKGKAPLREAEKHIDYSKLINKAVRNNLENVYKEHILTQVKDEDNLSDYSPSLDFKEISLEKATYEFTFPLFPSVKLGDYKKLEIKLPKLEITNEDLKNTEKEILEKYVVMLDSEGPIKLNDEVVFDFEGFINGEKFEGGEANDFNLKIGSKQFIPGFEEKMIGLKKNESKDLNLKFPESYHVKDLAGKDVVFKVTIHSIKTPDYPKVNEQFLKEVQINSLVKDKASYDEFLAHNALKNKYSVLVKEFMDKAIEKLMKNSEIKMSKIIVKEEAEKYYKNFLQSLSQQGITEKDYLEFTGTTKDQIVDNYSTEATKNLSQSFLLGKIVDVEKIKVSEEQYNKELEKLSSIYSIGLEQIKSFFTLQRYEQQKLSELIYQKLAELNDSEHLSTYRDAIKKIEDYEEKGTRSIVSINKEKHQEKK
ncbi:trigger factor [Metamycoplasma phocicerebrale]|uniref:Trigger factor n=1 Tax=Metamycoplasma phocicerebrale TaxID=142649 RepID=A0A3Q9VAI0_9BACT|nr:trigger factor [Metamycoplasma phocicerebrale]AZZ65773.1 trigger factor [Metamycoplasma phocicerebrale]